MVNDHSYLLRQQDENNTNSPSVFAINLTITLIYILRKFIVGNLKRFNKQIAMYRLPTLHLIIAFHRIVVMVLQAVQGK